VWGKFGEFAATLTKGMHLQVEGELRKPGIRTLRREATDLGNPH
jgi:hypothetical protein